MSRKTINRIGEENYNNFGSKIIIKEYRNSLDIDVYFPEYNWIAKNVRYDHFKEGTLKCPYEPRLYGHGYIGEGKYKGSENRKRTRVYNTWSNMLQRCYDPKYQEKHITYKGCNASEEFHNFQNFGEWDSENYYKIEGERMCLDKDILVKRNKVYSPDTCIYVPKTINLLFTKCDKLRGKSVIGTTFRKNGKYKTWCNIFNPKTGKSKREYLGVYATEVEAFEVYKCYKERNIKEVADYFKKEIPSELYDAMYNYEVEITD